MVQVDSVTVVVVGVVCSGSTLIISVTVVVVVGVVCSGSTLMISITAVVVVGAAIAARRPALNTVEDVEISKTGTAPSVLAVVDEVVPFVVPFEKFPASSRPTQNVHQ